MTAPQRPAYISETDVRQDIARWLAEDVGDGDVTTVATVAPNTTAQARIVARADGVIAGVEVATWVFESADASLACQWTVADGDPVAVDQVVGSISGHAHGLLSGERLALNLLQRMSGIATATQAMVAEAEGRAAILDTRKTAAGLRRLDKWAVRLGGGQNHRLGLHDMVLIKENHIAAAGGLEAALRRAAEHVRASGRELRIEVETRTPEEAERAAETGIADVILLDNMTGCNADGHLDTSVLEEAVRRVNGRAQTEASGNVSLETVARIAQTGVDYISSGALTHSVRALDLSLLVTLSSIGNEAAAAR